MTAGLTERDDSGDETAWAPAFPGQRPPFEPGHELSTKYGAHSPRKLAPVAEEYVDAVLADDSLAYLRSPAYLPAVQAWAAAEARVVLIERWVSDRITEQGMEWATESAAGRTSPLELLRRSDATALTHRARLGLDPISRAKLGKDVAQGRQADAAAALTAMREEHERVSKATVVDGD